MANKYKVGDRVRVTYKGTAFGGKTTGKTGIVTHVYNQDCTIKFDDGFKFGSKSTFDYSCSYLEPVEDLRVTVMRYLTEPGASRQRTQALEDLIEEDFFYEAKGSVQLSYLDGYLAENNSNFCAEGIKKAREALGLPNNTRHKFTLEFDTDTHCDDPGYLMERIAENLEDYDLGDYVVSNVSIQEAK